MRPIRFRLWSDTLKAMYTSDMEVHMWEVKPMPNGICNEKPTDILMQYTGLKDKKGEEIYEGDVVKIASPDSSKAYGAEVIYSCAQFAVVVADIFIPLGDIANWEVMGNIYENPELLKAMI